MTKEQIVLLLTLTVTVLNTFLILLVARSLTKEIDRERQTVKRVWGVMVKELNK